jgi:hypothetical protein
MSDTNAVKWLRAQGVDFELLEYEFSEIGAEHAAAAVGRPLEMVCKTLIVKATGNVFWIAIIPGDQPSTPNTPTSPRGPRPRRSRVTASAASRPSPCAGSCPS